MCPELIFVISNSDYLRWMRTHHKKEQRYKLAPRVTTGNQTVPKIIVDHKYVDILMKQVWNSIWIWHSHVLRSWRIFEASRATGWSPLGIGATKQSQQVRERTKTQKVITYQLKRGSVSGVERVHSKESFSMVAVFDGKGGFVWSNPKIDPEHENLTVYLKLCYFLALLCRNKLTGQWIFAFQLFFAL